MVQQLAKYPADNARCELVFCYSAMHGVGADYARRAFAAFQFKPEQLSMVASQEQPDPDFPTVKFPNPEEKGTVPCRSCNVLTSAPGALDLAIAHADSIGSTIVLANDPDADRFCAAEKSECVILGLPHSSRLTGRVEGVGESLRETSSARSWVTTPLSTTSPRAYR